MNTESSSSFLEPNKFNIILCVLLLIHISQRSKITEALNRSADASILKNKWVADAIGEKDLSIAETLDQDFKDLWQKRNAGWKIPPLKDKNNPEELTPVPRLSDPKIKSRSKKKNEEKEKKQTPSPKPNNYWYDPKGKGNINPLQYRKGKSTRW